VVSRRRRARGLRRRRIARRRCRPRSGGAASALADAIAPAERAAIVALALVELLWAPVARRSFLEEPIVRAYAARPSDAEIALYRRVPPGAVLDLPLSSSEPRGALAALRRSAPPPGTSVRSRHVTIHSRRRSRATSRSAPGSRGTGAPGALDALAALGFASVLVHEGELAAGDRDRLEAALAGSGRATEIARAPGLALFAVAGDAPVEASLAALSGGALAPTTAP
jgi:hypothetical protein